MWPEISGSRLSHTLLNLTRLVTDGWGEGLHSEQADVWTRPQTDHYIIESGNREILK